MLLLTILSKNLQVLLNFLMTTNPSNTKVYKHHAEALVPSGLVISKNLRSFFSWFSILEHFMASYTIGKVFHKIYKITLEGFSKVITHYRGMNNV